MATVSSAHTCSGYFCDKKMNEIHIVMTHNSLSTRGTADNQKYDLVKQFQDGVRGFNFDLLPYNNGKGRSLWTCHGLAGSCYGPYTIIRDLVAEINKPENRNEFVIIQVQNDGMIDAQKDTLKGLFGNLLIDDINEYLTDDLGEAIEDNKRVFLTTNYGSDTSRLLFRSGAVIGENDYDWKRCNRPIKRKRTEMPTGCRTSPNTNCKSINGYATYGDNSILLMNSFCGLLPSKRTARYTNKKCRLLKNAQRFRDSGNFEGGNGNLPNILMVDFYNEGDVFGAQKCLRDGNIGGSGCSTCDKKA